MQMKENSRISAGIWYRTIKPVLRRGLYAAKQLSARLLRTPVPFLEKTIPSLGHRLRKWHWIWQPTFSAQYLEKFYDRSEDPFLFDSNPYEAQKYAYSMELLSGRSYVNALEIGASEGAFTELLSPICRRVLAIEIAALAVERAKERLRNVANVTFMQASLPHQLPEDAFDLIIASDVLVYLPKDVLITSLGCIEERLMSGGYLFALHYLGNFGQPTLGREVHDLMKSRLDLDIIHDETVYGIGPKAEKGYTITIFRKKGQIAPITV